MKWIFRGLQYEGKYEHLSFTNMKGWNKMCIKNEEETERQRKGT